MNPHLAMSKWEYLSSITLGAHAQQGLQYSVGQSFCHSVILSFCLVQLIQLYS